MSDAWAELQALKSKRDHRRKRLEERKKERQLGLASTLIGQPSVSGKKFPTSENASSSISVPEESWPHSSSVDVSSSHIDKTNIDDDAFEECVLRCLLDTAVHLPVDSKQFVTTVNKYTTANHDRIVNIFQKFAAQQLISITEKVEEGGSLFEIVSADHAKLLAIVTGFDKHEGKRLKLDSEGDESKKETVEEKSSEDDVLSLLSMASTRERENKKLGEEILELLSRPTAKEKTLAEQFRSQGGSSVQQFCPHGTKSECRRVSTNSKPCSKLHFQKIIQSHTDESLGDCSFLNTCFHMESCKYVHYKVDTETKSSVVSRTETDGQVTEGGSKNVSDDLALEVAVPKTVLHPPQWISCDIRYFDMTILGHFSVIMADPPWDIHMELPYGTLSDDEMRQLNIPALQDDGLIFLWVTGRAMELGRECLQLWGYERVDELVWVKTNQLQRLIRTGRTGHWLNHGKEHCLVGMKGNPPINRGIDCDVIVAEVRATSHKPDEVYGIIERLSPGTRKLEMFGRAHNIQPNWITLGNQLDGTHLVDEEFKKKFYKRYPDGNCMGGKPK